MIEDLWYKNTIIYSLDLETFMDANGDGVGDFEGLSRRLDYLQSLGVDTIWLAPFQPTPNRDNGYDITDFYGVDPRHGTSGDFVEFMHQANKRGLKVIIDLVVNHTSDEHPWFKDACANKDSKYRDWYIWSKKRPKDWNKGMVFPGVQKATWTKHPVAGEYYYHRFYEFQPDLNIANPDVRAEIRRIMGYWLQLGVCGFRVDAVPFVLEVTEPGGGKAEMDFNHLREMREFLQWRSGSAVMLGEANVMPEETLKYFGDEGDGIHMMFNFYVNQHLFYALATSDIDPLVQSLEATKKIPGSAQWANFLRNHDELDLGRLDNEQRAKVFERFGPEEHMQLYQRGIRRRLASMLGSARELEFAYSVMFSLPGTPVIRYGDEIGMGENLDLSERDAVRTPMQWCGEEGACFSTAKKLTHPIITEGPYSARHVHVEAQRRDRDSLLSWTTRMIRLRKECPEIGWGRWEILPAGSPRVLAMCYEWRGNALLTLHNFADHPEEADVTLKLEGGELLADLISNHESRSEEDGRHKITLEAHGYRWYRVGGLNYALRRTPR